MKSLHKEACRFRNLCMIYVHAGLDTPSSSAAPVRPITLKAKENFRPAGRHAVIVRSKQILP